MSTSSSKERSKPSSWQTPKMKSITTYLSLGFWSKDKMPMLNRSNRTRPSLVNKITHHCLMAMMMTPCSMDLQMRMRMKSSMVLQRHRRLTTIQIKMAQIRNIILLNRSLLRKRSCLSQFLIAALSNLMNKLANIHTNNFLLKMRATSTRVVEMASVLDR